MEYLEVVNSSLQYLLGICLVFSAIVWCVQAILPDHVPSYMSLRVIGLRVRAAVKVLSNLSALWVFCELKWVDLWNKKSNGIVVLALSEELPLRFLCGSHIFCVFFFFFKRVFAVDVVSLSMPAKLSLSKITGCHAEVAFVTHGMIRPDNFSTRKSGNTLGPREGDSHMKQTGMLVGNFEFNP